MVSDTRNPYHLVRHALFFCRIETSGLQAAWHACEAVAVRKVWSVEGGGMLIVVEGGCVPVDLDARSVDMRVSSA
jgi:hypothetical protein